MMDKTELVRALAIEMGHEDILTTRFNEHKYDPTTGTLYCSGKIVDGNAIERAKEYFRGQINLYQDKANNGGQRASELALYYEAALAGINYLQDQGSKAGM